MSLANDDLEWDSYALELGVRLTAVRRSRGVTQEALALASGLSRNQIQNIERSRSSGKNSTGNTTLKTIFILARALGVPPDLIVPSAGHVPADRNPIIDAGWATLAVEIAQQTAQQPLPRTTPTSSRVR